MDGRILSAGVYHVNNDTDFPMDEKSTKAIRPKNRNQVMLEGGKRIYA